MRNPIKGAATTINCAINPKLNSQECHYYDSCAITSPIPLSLLVFSSYFARIMTICIIEILIYRSNCGISVLTMSKLG